MPDTCTLQTIVTNHLDPRVETVRWIAGIVGDNPSRYAKSPSIWNPVLTALGMDALYVPFDVPAARLRSFVDAVRYDERVKGFSVTMPHKVAIVPLLDELDAKARAISAVNVVVRRQDGRLIGANTDGSGGLASLTTPLSNHDTPFLDDLAGTDVLLIGSGGAARALAWYLADAIGNGRLYIASRNREAGGKLAAALGARHPATSWIEESALHTVAHKVRLIVNATTKGQSGLRRLPDGRVTCLEPYSSLAPAAPAVYPSAEAEREGFFHTWLRESLPDLMVNLERSLRLMASIPAAVRVMDIIYSPLETTLLRHARWSGHRTLNGKGMNICQAADALFHWVFRDHFEATGRYDPTTYRAIVDQMAKVW